MESQLKSDNAQAKRFSVMMKNMDHNSYRAYKMMNEDDKSSMRRTNHHEVIKGEKNNLKYPLDLKEKRFRWQTSKNLGERWELTGNILKRNSGNEIAAKWENLMQKTASLTPTNSLRNR
jgi:midasin (ATPase involved in ribosome maturation)